MVPSPLPSSFKSPFAVSEKWSGLGAICGYGSLLRFLVGTTIHGGQVTFIKSVRARLNRRTRVRDTSFILQSSSFSVSFSSHTISLSSVSTLPSDSFHGAGQVLHHYLSTFRVLYVWSGIWVCRIGDFMFINKPCPLSFVFVQHRRWMNTFLVRLPFFFSTLRRNPTALFVFGFYTLRSPFLVCTLSLMASCPG